MLPILNSLRHFRMATDPARFFISCIPNSLISGRFKSNLSYSNTSLELQSQKNLRIYRIERNTFLSLPSVLRQTSRSPQFSFSSFWKLGGVLIAGCVIKSGNDLLKSVYAEEVTRKDRLGSVDKLKPNVLANPVKFSELEADGDVYELVSEKNLALKHYKIDPFWGLNDLGELKKHLSDMHLSADLKGRINDLNEESYKEAVFSRKELADLRKELSRLGLNELNKKLGNPYRVSFQNGLLVWRSVHAIDAEDVQAIVDFETRHGRRVHINTGTHGDPNGNTVVDEKDLAEANFSKEDLETAWFKDNVSVHIVSSYARNRERNLIFS